MSIQIFGLLFSMMCVFFLFFESEYFKSYIFNRVSNRGGRFR